MLSEFLHTITTRYVPTRTYNAITRAFLRLSPRRKRHDDSIPPANKTFVYGVDPDFHVIGQEFLRYFVELAGLKPEHKVLDIGCGIGRLALSLEGYLSDAGEYRGFDIIKDGIEWCKENITSRKPNFLFEAVDLYNKTYNPSGKLRAAEFSFPYPNDYFDLVYTTSVFTHMLAQDMEHYIAETARVLKPGGRCLHTFFLLNQEAEELMKKRKAIFDFAYQLKDCHSISRFEPEKAIAYEEPFIMAVYQRYGLRVIEPIRYGHWSGREQHLSGQDIVLAEKT